eukprot:gene18879-biopygen12986
MHCTLCRHQARSPAANAPGEGGSTRGAKLLPPVGAAQQQQQRQQQQLQSIGGGDPRSVRGIYSHCHPASLSPTKRAGAVSHPECLQQPANRFEQPVSRFNIPLLYSGKLVIVGRCDFADCGRSGMADGLKVLSVPRQASKVPRVVMGWAESPPAKCSFTSNLICN